MKKLKIISFLFLVLYMGCKTPEKVLAPVVIPEPYATESVFIIVMDGARYSETFGDSLKRYMPNLHKIADRNIHCSNFLNGGYTYTNSGHTSLITGFRQPIKNDAFGAPESPIKPSIFQYWRKMTDAPKEKAWIVCSKDKLEALGNTRDTAWKNQYLPSVDCGNSGYGSGYRDDSLTFVRVTEVMDEHHPNLMLINFKEPDGMGHANNWEGYLKNITRVDGFIKEIIKKAKNDPYYNHKITIFVTNDHGRHLDGIRDGFINHGDDCYGCRHIMCLATGPDFKKGGEVSDKEYYQIDITVTVAELLGMYKYDMPGKVMWDLFKE